MKKRNLSKKLLMTILCVLFALSLTACGGNNDSSSNQENADNGNSKNEYTLSSFLDQKEPVILYSVGKKVGKDETPEKIYYFKDGRITVFSSIDKTIGELSKMKDDEIIEFATETMKNGAKVDIQETADGLKYQIEQAKTNWPEELETGWDTYFNGSNEYDSEVFPSTYQTRYEWCEEFINYDEEIFSSPFEIMIKTDSTGNNPEKECITFATTQKARFYNNHLTIPYLYGEKDDGKFTDDIELDAYTSSITPIYDTFYATLTSGNKVYMTRVDNDKVTIIPDKLGAKGTSTDELSAEFKKSVADELSHRYEEFKKQCPKIAEVAEEYRK